MEWPGWDHGNFQDGEDVNEVGQWWFYNSAFVEESRSQMEPCKDEDGQSGLVAQHRSLLHHLMIRREE